jgi:hypothetical protein
MIYTSLKHFLLITGGVMTGGGASVFNIIHGYYSGYISLALLMLSFLGYIIAHQREDDGYPFCKQCRNRMYHLISAEARDDR